MERILITGGAGFVGSSLAIRLKAAYPGAEVICMDNLYRRGSEINRDRIVERGITFIKADVRERTSFDLPACDLIVDAAAEPSVLAGSEGDVTFVIDTNLGGTLNGLEAARRWSAAFVFLSSSRIYPLEALRQIELEESDTRFEISATQSQPGITLRGISEDFPVQGARTLYGATKFASEIMVEEYAAQFGVRTMINRYGVLAGPWQMGKVEQGVVALWVASHHFGMPLRYIGYQGRQVRDALHIEDMADLLLLQLGQADQWRGQIYNVGGEREISFSLRELTEHARQATGRSLELGCESGIRAGDVPLYITDAARVREAFGWQPQRSMSDIVEDTARWIADHERTLRPFLVSES